MENNNNESITDSLLSDENEADQSIDKPTAMKAIDDMAEYFKDLKRKKLPDKSFIKNILAKQNERNLKRQEEQKIEESKGNYRFIFHFFNH